MKRLFIPKTITSSYTHYKLTREEIIKLKSDGLVLDIGARNSPYAKQFKKYVSLDIVPFQNLDVVGDGQFLPFKENSFEMVMLLGVLEYTWNPQKVVDEIYRVLKPGGKLIATVPFMLPYHPYSEKVEDYWRYTPGSIKKLLSIFQIQTIKIKGSLFSILAIYYENLLQKTRLTLFYPFVKIFYLLDKLFFYKNTALFYFVDARK